MREDSSGDLCIPVPAFPYTEMAIAPSRRIGYAQDMIKNTRLDPRNVEIVDTAVARILRSKSGAERLEMAFEMYESVWDMLSNKLSTDHPEWTEDDVRAEVVKRLSHGYTTRQVA